VLIRRARQLYAKDALDVELDNTVYALDSTTIGLCLSLFSWADFRTTKAAIKLHTLLDLRGAIPSFIHVSTGKMGDAPALDLITIEAGSISVMDRGYVDFTRLYTITIAGAFFVTRTKHNMDYHRVYSYDADKAAGIICDQVIALDGFSSQKKLPATPASRPFLRSRNRQKTRLPHQQFSPPRRHHRCTVQTTLES
jgi:hypothetical protein